MSALVRVDASPGGRRGESAVARASRRRTLERARASRRPVDEPASRRRTTSAGAAARSQLGDSGVERAAGSLERFVCVVLGSAGPQLAVVEQSEVQERPRVKPARSLAACEPL